MDFFERAHVAKKHSKKDLKETKSDEAVKKQLKQMLEGYRRSDNKLIRSSEDAYNDPEKGLFEDSSSVSGFSDLVLSNSSKEANSSLEVMKSDTDDVMSDTNDISKDSVELKQHEETISSSIGSIGSISECKDIMESLSDTSDSENENQSASELTDNISVLSSLLETVTEIESEDSVSFDVDGALATKILEKLGKTDKSFKKKTKKRKLIEIEMPKVERQDETDSENNIVESDEIVTRNDISDTDENIGRESDDNSIINSNVSSPFVSVIANEMPNQSFNEILGDYKHSTIKNMPSDIQTVTQPINDKSIFTTESIAVDDICMEDDDAFSSDENELKEKVTEFSERCDEVDTLNDSTTYDDTLHSAEGSELSMELTENFLNPVRVYISENCSILVLKHPAELYVHGKVNVNCLGGNITVFGCSLKICDQNYEIYAPNYSHAHCLKTVENHNAYHGLFSKLISRGLSVYEAEEIVTSIGEYDGILCLSPLKSKVIDFVENNFTVSDVFSKRNRHVDNSLRMASETLGCSLYISKPYKCFEENPSWSPVIQYGFNQRSRGIVCGGKAVGKSTFLRYCVNQLLSQGPVLVIDLDPGQAEFTVAGCVSATIVTEPLLGPNFTHLKRPDVMLYLGMVNTMDNPRRYAAAVSELIAHCHSNERFATMPWVVNTMGMCNAMGLKFTSLIILLTKPTYLLQMDSKNAKMGFGCHLNPGIVRNLYNDQFQHDRLFRNVSEAEELEYSFFVCHSMENSVKKVSSLSPRDVRYLNYLAYFGELLRARAEVTLLGITPYEVNFRDVNLGMNVKVQGDASLKVINGKIVALCQLERDNVARVFTLGDKALLCHGHGLIRGIDYEKEKLYIITPYSAILVLVNTLVYADWVPELQGQEKQLPQGATVPYRTASAYQQRQLMIAPRRRFNPMQLIKMSRNS